MLRSKINYVLETNNFRAFDVENVQNNKGTWQSVWPSSICKGYVVPNYLKIICTTHRSIW